MKRFCLYIAMIFTAALVALAGFTTPSAAAAPTVHCDSTGGGTFFCETTLSGRLYYWATSSNARITQNLGATIRGTCTIGTKPTVSVTAYSPVSNSVINRPQYVTLSTSFACTSLAL